MRHRAIYLALSLVVLGAVSAAHAQVTAQGRARSSAAFLLGIEVGLLTTGDTQLQTEVEPGDFSVTAQGATLEVPGVASVISAASSTMGTAAGIDSEVTSITGEVTADVLNGTVEVLGTSARAEVSCTEISANATVNALMVGNQAIDVPLNPQPNTVIEVLGVARVILNRQNMTINQATRSASIEVDAVVIEVLSGGGVLEVVLASAAASLSNLPASCPVIGGPGGMPNLVNSSKLAQLVTDGGTPGFADPGDRIRFTVRADNSGTAAATAVNILDRLPRFTTLDQASIRLNGATVASTINNCPANVNFNGCPGEVAVDAARQCLSANINDLASDQSADLTFEVTVNQGATANICNTAFIGDQERSAIVPIASGVPPGGTPNLATSRKTAGFVIDDRAQGFADPGDRLRFTIRATNSGTAAAVGVLILDRLPRFVTLDQTSVRLNGATAAFTVGNCPGNVSFTGCSGETPVDTSRQCLSAAVGNLAAGQSADLTFEVTVNADISGNICNAAFVGDRPVGVDVPGPRRLVTSGGGGGGCALNPSVPGSEAWPVFLLAVLWILHRRRRASVR